MDNFVLFAEKFKAKINTNIFRFKKFIFFMAVVPKLFLVAYNLWVPYCQHVPPCSRKSQCAKYHSIKGLEHHN